MTKAGCFPTDVSINPLRLSSNYRDYFGDAHAMLTELTDPILGVACYVPRIIHAPDSASENAGVPAGGFLEYALSLPPGSFILGFLHTFTSLTSLNGTDAPVQSGFKFQITDVARQFQFFGKPIPEAWLLNDQPAVNPQELTNPSTLRVLNPSPRLLTAPYPVAPPGMFKIDFWNSLNQANTLIRLSLLVAVPNPAMPATVGGAVASASSPASGVGPSASAPPTVAPSAPAAASCPPIPSTGNVCADLTLGLLLDSQVDPRQGLYCSVNGYQGSHSVPGWVSRCQSAALAAGTLPEIPFQASPPNTDPQGYPAEYNDFVDSIYAGPPVGLGAFPNRRTAWPPRRW